MVEIYFDILNRLGEDHECDKRTDRQTEPPLAIASSIGVDLAGLLGGRMTSAEGGSVPSRVGYGEECPLSSRLRGVRERRELP